MTFVRYSEYLTDVREAWGPFWPLGSPEAVWMALGDSKRVGRIDKTTGELVVSEELDGVCYAISEVRNAWVYAVAGKRLYQLDPTTLDIENSVELFKEERGDGWVDQRDDVLIAPAMDGISVFDADTLALLYEVQVHFHVGKIDYDEPNTRWILYSRVGSEAAYFTLPSEATAWPTDECYWLFSITYNYETDDWNTPVFEDYGCAETLTETWYEDVEWPETALLIQVATGVDCRDAGWCPDDPGQVVPDDPSLVTWEDWIEEHRPLGGCSCEYIHDEQPNTVFTGLGEASYNGITQDPVTLYWIADEPEYTIDMAMFYTVEGETCSWSASADISGATYVGLFEDGVDLFCVGGVVTGTVILDLMDGVGPATYEVVFGGP